MILMMSNSKENQGAATRVLRHHEDVLLRIDEIKGDLSAAKDPFIVLDVDANDHFVRHLEPHTLAKILLDSHLPTHISSVIFLVSDINAFENLRTFSRAFIETLQQAWNHEVTAYVPTDLNYASTVIIPPNSPDAEWQVFGFRTRPAEEELCLSQWEKMRDKVVLWRGENILSWIKTKEKAVNTLPDDIDKIIFSL